MRSRLLLTLLLFVSGAARAQNFEGLATNLDGSVAFFSSTSRQAGTQQSFHSKIFRWDSVSGVRLVAEEADEGDLTGCTSSNYFHLTDPQVGRNGQLLGYTGSRPATGFKLCSPAELHQGIVLQPARIFAGKLGLSPDARYAVTSSRPADASNYHTVTDLITGLSGVVAGGFSGAPQQITNGGSVLSLQDEAVTVNALNGYTRVLPAQQPVAQAAIDPAGRFVLYASNLQPGIDAQLSLLDITSGEETVLDRGFGFRPLALSGDGSTLYYAGRGEVKPGMNGIVLYTLALPGGMPRVVARQNFSSLAVSGDGRVVFGAVEGAIERLDTVSGAVTRVTPAPPAAAVYLTSGKLATLAGAGSLLTTAQTDAVIVSVCGNPAQPRNGPVQIPFTQPEGDCTIVISANGYESAANISVFNLVPEFANTLFHSDYRAIANAAPARPGEVILAYLTGLGPVDDSGNLINKLDCSFDDVPGTILYAGVAPGFAGIYQIDVRVPTLYTKSARLTCRFPASPAYYADAAVALDPTP